MVNKRERLRQGLPIEFEPGVYAQLNPQNRSLKLSTGKELALSETDIRDLFPANEEARKYAQEREEVQKGIQESPFGEFGHQLTESGLPGVAKDWYHYFKDKPEEYLRNRQARKEVSQEISKESPWTSGAATLASYVPDIVATRGMSGLVAAPLLTAASAGPRILEEPLQVAGESALAAGGGYLLDKATNWLGKAAGYRKSMRDLPVQKQQVAQANLQQQQQHNVLLNQIKTHNDQLLADHQFKIQNTKNSIAQINQIEAQKTAAREAEIIKRKNDVSQAKKMKSSNETRLENEYQKFLAEAKDKQKIADDEFTELTKKYNQELAELPALQKKAQQEYSKNVVDNANRIERAFPKGAKFNTSSIGVDEFIDSNISKSGFAASKEGVQASKILKSIFPEGETITAKDLTKRYKAIEEAIQRSSPEVKQLLNEFKNHLGERIPSILENSITFNRVIPWLKSSTIDATKKALNRRELVFHPSVIKLNKNIDTVFDSLNSTDFISKMKDRNFLSTFAKQLAPLEIFLPKGVKSLSKGKILDDAVIQQNQFVENFVNDLQKKLEFHKLDVAAMQAGRDVYKKLGTGIRQTFGFAPEVTSPAVQPVRQTIPTPNKPLGLPDVAPYMEPPPISGVPNKPQLPVKPALMGNPAAPAPLPEPTLAPPMGSAERAGEFLEKPRNLRPSLSNLTKLGALKYALGKAALPVEAGIAGGYGILKGLTAPGAEAARTSFKQAGVAAIEAMAQKYPSYDNGILQDPMDRRSLTREIEDDEEIPPQQKALFQSKVNRGKRLGERIQ